MTRFDVSIESVDPSLTSFRLTVLTVFSVLVSTPAGLLWSAESEAGFTITSGKTHAEAFEWVVENRVKHTYPMTAMRMLREIGAVREGTCIDIGCGTGNLDIELAKRSNFKIIGLYRDRADSQSEVPVDSMTGGVRCDATLTLWRPFCSLA